MGHVGRSIPILLIRLYQHTLSLILPSSCRFYPSCSNYAVESIAVHGVWHGTILAIRRILKCHPFHPGGYDPVPPVHGGCSHDSTMKQEN